MKLSKIYCHNESLFPSITFNDGLNVIFAKVKDYDAKDKDAHNLGKTFLTAVIDFCLLGSIKPSHAFKKSQSRFGEFIFFLEIKTNSGKYVTVRRPVKSVRNSMCINVAKSSKNMRSVPVSEWTHSGLSEKSAEELLDAEIALSAIAPYNYRKGLGYFLRRQGDYDDLYRITKFGRGKDLDWKPFMALLLGFDWELVRRKYDLEDDINSIESEIITIEKDAGASSGQLDEIRGKIQLMQRRVENRRNELDSFEFYEADFELTRELVQDIETTIGQLNEKRYSIMSKIDEILQAQKTQLSFDIDRLEQLFQEVGLYFPDQLKKDYNDLLEFNRKMTTSRMDRLATRLSKLEVDLSTVNRQLQDLDARRAIASDTLRNAETMVKYKSLQRLLLKDEEDLLALQARESRLDATSDRKAELRELQIQRTEIVKRLEEMVNHPPAHYVRLRQLYGDLAEDILSVFAVLSLRVNSKGNLEFGESITQEATSSVETSEGDGFSYKKMLCVCFDLAMLAVFANQSFYRFAYHDGVFETLDDRRKNKLLERVRKLIETHNIQYILTVIDSDLPRNSQDEKLFFSSEEVVRELHDLSDDGRLFPGPPF